MATIENPTIIIQATLILAGEQRTTLRTHHARTDEARAILTWDTAMMTFSTLAQAQGVLDGFLDAAGTARGLPAEAESSLLGGFVDYSTLMPAVSVVFIAAPAVTVVPGAPASRATGWVHTGIQWLDIRIGGVLFRVVDRLAYDSARASLEDLVAVAETTFATRRRR